MHAWTLRRAARVIHGGGVIAYPTETVWGLGCDPADFPAVRRIWTLKGRAAGKGLILIAPRLALLEPWITALNDEQRGRLERPGERPITWVVPARPDTPAWLTGGRSTLAVRVTHHVVVRALCEATQVPLVSTSANPAGRPPARNALTVRRYFDDRLDLIVPGVAGDTGRPSEIRQLETGKVLRKS